MPLVAKSFSPDAYRNTSLVGREHEGMRLDHYIRHHFETFSRKAIQEKIALGEILIENRPGRQKPGTKVHENDRVSLVSYRRDGEDEHWRGRKLAVSSEPDIVFEDDGLYAVSKPPYMSVHPTGKHLFNCATVVLEAKYGHKVHSIHRLDRETSGLVLLGKNPTCASELTRQFENGTVKKCYFFIAKKTPLYRGSWDFCECARLAPADLDEKRVAVAHFDPGSRRGKYAETHFRILFDHGTYALGLAFPKTGRQHQIRVHAALNGLPLLGDKLYLGGFETFRRFKDNAATDEDHRLVEIPRHALHAVALVIDHGGNRKLLTDTIADDLGRWVSDTLTIETQKLESTIEEEIRRAFSVPTMMP